MTASALSWPSEVMIADPAQIAEAHIRRIAPYPRQDDFDGIHIHDITIDTIVNTFSIAGYEIRRFKTWSVLDNSQFRGQQP